MSWLPAKPVRSVSVWRDEGCVIPKLTIARKFIQRGVGLMGRVAVPISLGKGFLFPNCGNLHTCFMRFPLQIAFVDEAGVVLVMHSDVGPWRIVKGPRGTKHALEWADNRQRVMPGDVLRLEDGRPA